MTGQRPTGTSAVAVLTVLVLGATAAVAQEPVGDLAVADEYLLSYATEFSVSLHEAEDHARQRSALQPLLDAAEEHPAFAGAWIDRQDGFKVVIDFVGKVPAGVENLQPERTNVEFRGGASATLVELVAQAAEIRSVLRDSGYKHFVTAIHSKSGEVSVGLLTSDAVRLGLPAELAVSNVRLSSQAGPLSTYEANAVYGGDEMPLSQTSQDFCTSAFSVVKNGVTGILTAGHCPNTLWYRQNDGTTYATTFQAQHRGLYGDFQWHTTAYTEFDDFYYNDTARRDVSGIGGAPVVDDYLCFHGEATGGASCDNVLSTWVSYTGSSGIEYDRLVAMDDDNTTNGDSGGPWVDYRTAWGVHHGDVVIFGSSRNVFSQVRWVDEALPGDVYIKTS